MIGIDFKNNLLEAIESGKRFRDAFGVSQNKYDKFLEVCKKHCKRICGYKKSCCNSLFCDYVFDDSPWKIKKLYDSKKEVPFMGDNGCLVPPEYRKRCLGFICDDFKNDRKARREYQRKLSKLKLDDIPDATKDFNS